MITAILLVWFFCGLANVAMGLFFVRSVMSARKPDTKEDAADNIVGFDRLETGEFSARNSVVPPARTSPPSPLPPGLSKKYIRGVCPECHNDKLLAKRKVEVYKYMTDPTPCTYIYRRYECPLCGYNKAFSCMDDPREELWQLQNEAREFKFNPALIIEMMEGHRPLSQIKTGQPFTTTWYGVDVNE